MHGTLEWPFSEREFVKGAIGVWWVVHGLSVKWSWQRRKKSTVRYLCNNPARVGKHLTLECSFRSLSGTLDVRYQNVLSDAQKILCLEKQLVRGSKFLTSGSKVLVILSGGQKCWSVTLRPANAPIWADLGAQSGHQGVSMGVRG